MEKGLVLNNKCIKLPALPNCIFHTKAKLKCVKQELGRRFMQLECECFTGSLAGLTTRECPDGSVGGDASDRVRALPTGQAPAVASANDLHLVLFNAKLTPPQLPPRAHFLP